MEDIARKRDELENYLGGLAKKLFVMLEGTFLQLSDLLSSTNHKLSTHYFSVGAEFCQNFEAETGRIETSLDPINSPVKDEAAMNVL